MKDSDSDIVSRHCGNCVYLRSTCTAESGLCTVYDRDTMLEDNCEHFANIAIIGEFRRIKIIVVTEEKHESR